MAPTELDSRSLPRLPDRHPESHKGTFGTALLIGGARGMAGAISLAGMAALRAGAGLVRLAVPDVCLELVASFEPSYMTAALPSDTAGRIALDARRLIDRWATSATAVACGPGLGRSLGLTALVCGLYRSLAKPMVVDADALNALAARPQAMDQAAGPRILTPHPGEFARLVGRTRLPRDQREAAAVDLAGRWGVVLVLKGHRTLITDGQRLARNATGNPGMATGGTGDVLTGVITALLCQGLAPLDAARLGVYLHGLAGDLAAARLGQESMIARDLIDFLPEAFQQHRARTAGRPS